MISIQRENIDQCIKDIGPLLEKHWLEVALHHDDIKLEPDIERYARIEELGKLVIVTARDGANLIGYSIFLLQNHIHYASLLYAANDVIFLDSAYRKGTTAGIRLIKTSESILQAMGCKKIVWHIKVDHDWSAILGRMGYQEEEIIMGKLLE